MPRTKPRQFIVDNDINVGRAPNQWGEIGAKEEERETGTDNVRNEQKPQRLLLCCLQSSERVGKSGVLEC